MKKYGSLFTAYFSSAITYRANLVSALIMEAISVSSIVVLWVAVYRSQNYVAGYSFSAALAYYLTIPIIGFFTSVGLSSQLSKEIKSGFFSNYLLKPMRFWLASLTGVLATKLSYLVLVSPIVGAVLVYLVLGGLALLSPFSILAALIMVVLALLFHFVLDLAISFGAFWLDDVWAFTHIKDILFSVLGGLNFPLDFVAGPLHALFTFLPFQYLYYVPIMYLLGKRSGIGMLFTDITRLLVWTVAAAFVALVLWRLGLKKYGAYGH